MVLRSYVPLLHQHKQNLQIMKKYSFVATNCNVIVSATSKANAIAAIQSHGFTTANTKNVFLYR